MAYNTAELEKQSVEIINSDPDIVFIEDVVAELGIDKTTFYAHKLNESNLIKNALHKNKSNTKKHLRKKWRDNDNATTDIALYKLVGDDKDRKKLSNNDTVDHNLRVPTGEIIFKIAGEDAAG